MTSIIITGFKSACRSLACFPRGFCDRISRNQTHLVVNESLKATREGGGDEERNQEVRTVSASCSCCLNVCYSWIRSEDVTGRDDISRDAALIPSAPISQRINDYPTLPVLETQKIILYLAHRTKVLRSESVMLSVVFRLVPPLLDETA